MFKKILLGACVAALVVAGGVVGFGVRALYTRHVGVTLRPSEDIAVREVRYYLQKDPAWAKDTIGSSASTMGQAGCLISCVASALDAMGIPMTPPELNRRLTAVEGFDGDSLLWYKVHEAIPSVRHAYTRVFTSQTIQRDLAQGFLPLVNVRYRGLGGTHWVMVIGAQNGDFLVCDPLNDAREPLPLSVHGKVFAYRVMVPDGADTGR